MLPEGSIQAEEHMTVDERRKYLKLMRPRYQVTNRKGQGMLLTEMEQMTGLHRKSLLRLLHTPSLERTKRRRQRQRGYGLDVERVVLHVWESEDYVRAERLTPSLLPMARHLTRFDALVLTPEVKNQRATISPTTVERMLHKNRAEPRALAPERTRASEPGDQRSPHGAHPVGHPGARPF